MKNNDLLKVILLVIFLPLIPLYFVYKSSRLSKRTKGIVISVYIIALITIGIINKTGENQLDKNVAPNLNTVETNISDNDKVVKDDNDSSLVVSVKENEDTIEVDDTTDDEKEDYKLNNDIKEYTTMVSSWAYNFAGDFSDLSELLINNNIESTSWNNKVLITSNKLIEDCRLVIDFKPPTGYEKINENVINACTNYMYGVTDLLDGLRELDEDKIESSQIFFMLGTEHIKIATEQLNNK